MPNRTIFIYLLIFFSLFVLSCRRVSQLSEINIAHAYTIERNIFQADFRFLHLNEQSSRVQLNLESSQLLYTRDVPEDLFLAQFSVHYRVFSSLQSRSLIDSATVFFQDTMISDQSYIINRVFDFNAPFGDDYWIYIQIKDITTDISQSFVIPIEKSYSFQSPFFTLTDTQENSMLSPFYLGQTGAITLQYYDNIDVQLTVNRYLTHNIIPSPAFAEHVETDIHFDYEIDTTFTISLNRGVNTLNITQPGLYRIFNPENIRDGFFIHFYHVGFPFINEAENMILPLRYITSHEEFNELTNKATVRYAAERFWMRSTGNPDRAREMISNYYRRVEQANLLFTTHVPGWQTDQGMIYIVFGAPDRVFRTDQYESWYYEEGIRSSSANFIFRREENIFSNHNYILTRSQTYRTIWNHAVAMWRR